MKMLLHIFYDLAQTKTVIRKWLAIFLLSLFHIFDYDYDYDLIQGKAMPVNPLNT